MAESTKNVDAEIGKQDDVEEEDLFSPASDDVAVVVTYK